MQLSSLIIPFFSKKSLPNAHIGYGHATVKCRLHLSKSLLFIACYFTSENLAFMVQAGFELKNEEFRPEYEDLKNHQTEKLIDKIEQAVGISHWKDRGSLMTLSKLQRVQLDKIEKKAHIEKKA